MRLIPLLKQAVTINDFFYSTQLLRFKQEGQYRTFTGGLLSLGIIIFITIGFANMIISMLNRTTINTTSSVQKNVDPPLTTLHASPQKNYMFGIEIWRHDLNANKRFFDVKAVLYTQQTGWATHTEVPLVPCTRQHWSTFPEVLKSFDKLQISYWLCPPIGTSYDIYGKYTSDKSQQLGLEVYPCDNATEPSRPCATPAQIDALFVSNYNSFYFTLYTINEIVNPDSTDYIDYYLQDKNYVLFGPNVAAQAMFYITDYTIATDNSIWPFESFQEQKGFFALDLAVNHPLQYSTGNYYAAFYFAKSSDSYHYKRVVLKISEVFSFIGGIIGAVFAVLFFLKNFTDFSLQTVIASTVFRKPKDKQETPDESSKQESKQEEQRVAGSFLKFLKFGIYTFSKFIGKQIEWKDMKQLKLYRSQIVKQLDIQSIIKRLIFLQHSITYLLQDFQLEGLQLQRPVTPEQIKKLRQRCHFEQQLHSESQSSDESEQRESYQIKQENKMDDIIIEKTPGSNSNRQLAYPKIRFQEPQDSPTTFVRTFLTNTQKKKNEVIIHSVSDCNQEPEVLAAAKHRPSIDFSVMEYLRFGQGSKNKKKLTKTLRRQSARKTYLKNLEISVEKGNLVSKKIWDTLQQKTEKSMNGMAIVPQSGSLNSDIST